MRIDYVFHTGDLAAIAAHTAQFDGMSDHRGVVGAMHLRKIEAFHDVECLDHGVAGGQGAVDQPGPGGRARPTHDSASGTTSARAVRAR